MYNNHSKWKNLVRPDGKCTDSGYFSLQHIHSQKSGNKHYRKAHVYDSTKMVIISYTVWYYFGTTVVTDFNHLVTHFHHLVEYYYQLYYR